MSSRPDQQAPPPAPAQAALPDRECTWCKVPMMKRLVGEGHYLHYTCPTCLCQHTLRRETNEL
jgi:hypothetical protein